MEYGYIRVSTKAQHEARQLDALLARGIPKKRLFMDKQSGKDFNRPAYQKLLKTLKPGDLLVVKSIDRLGRNYEEILEQWRYLTRVKKVHLSILDMPLLNTANGKDLTGTLIADIVLQLLSYVAQTEREYLHQRQAEGIAAAKARGVRFGKAKKPLPPGFREMQTAWQQGKVSLRQAAAALSMSHMTFYRRCRENNAQLFVSEGRNCDTSLFPYPI